MATTATCSSITTATTTGAFDDAFRGSCDHHQWTDGAFPTYGYHHDPYCGTLQQPEQQQQQQQPLPMVCEPSPYAATAALQSVAANHHHHHHPHQQHHHRQQQQQFAPIYPAGAQPSRQRSTGAPILDSGSYHARHRWSAPPTTQIGQVDEAAIRDVEVAASRLMRELFAVVRERLLRNDAAVAASGGTPSPSCRSPPRHEAEIAYENYLLERLVTLQTALRLMTSGRFS